MTEDELISFLLTQIDSTSTLTDSYGRSIKFLKWGPFNRSLGPDFTDCLIQLDGKLFSGDVEVDLCTSSWFNHGHFRNSNFNKVILQLVSTINHAPLRLETAEGKRILCAQVPLEPIKKFLVLKGLRKNQEIKKPLMPCTHVYLRGGKDKGLLKKILIDLGTRRLVGKGRQVLAENRRLKSVQMHFLFQMVKFLLKPLPMNAQILSDRAENGYEEVLEYGIRMIRENPALVHHRRVRPSNDPFLRMAKLRELCAHTTFLELLSDVGQLYDKNIPFPASLVCRITQSLREAGYNPTLTCLLLVNSIIPCLLAFFPDWRDSLIAHFLELEGGEDNSKTRFIQDIFGIPRTGFQTEAEQQGMISLYDNHCKQECRACPVLLSQGIHAFEECGIVEYEPF